MVPARHTTRVCGCLDHKRLQMNGATDASHAGASARLSGMFLRRVPQSWTALVFGDETAPGTQIPESHATITLVIPAQLSAPYATVRALCRAGLDPPGFPAVLLVRLLYAPSERDILVEDALASGRESVFPGVGQEGGHGWWVGWRVKTRPTQLSAPFVGRVLGWRGLGKQKGRPGAAFFLRAQTPYLAALALPSLVSAACSFSTSHLISSTICG